MKLSILLVMYNMPRECPRTLVSMLPPYQKDIDTEDYEVLVLDNGSTAPLPAELVDKLPANVRLLGVPDPNGSPGRALNWGAGHAGSDRLMFCIDGARMFSDRLVASAIETLENFPDAFVYTLGWHLGPGVQMRSVFEGYDQVVEDELLAAANWQFEPDNLFKISALAGSSANGITGPISESNAFAVSRRLFEEVGGYDDRFKIPGGSTSNLEIFTRYVTRPNALNICLAAEGTFHQVHGGVATSNPDISPTFFDEYAQIFGRPYEFPVYRTMLQGLPRKAAFAALSAAAGVD